MCTELQATYFYIPSSGASLKLLMILDKLGKTAKQCHGGSSENFYMDSCNSLGQFLHQFPLCDGTRHFDREGDRDQGRNQKYDGTGTNAGTINMTGPGPGPRTGTKDRDQFWSGTETETGTGTRTGSRTGTETMKKDGTRTCNKKKP